MFDDPSPDTNIMDWLYECLTSLLLHGNAWGYILSRDGYGYPQQIQWQPPDMVTVIDDEAQPYNPLRSRVYFYGRLMQRDEYFHIKAFSLAGRTEGISPLRAFALTILNGLESTRYGTDWFKSGGFPPGTFKNNEIEIDPSQAAEIRSSLNRSIRNREPLVYGRDWDYHPVTVPPSEAQFIEAMQMNATQLAAVYGLPPNRVGGKRGELAHLLHGAAGCPADHRGAPAVGGPAGNSVLPDRPGEPVRPVLHQRAAENQPGGTRRDLQDVAGHRVQDGR